jgi:hypothetical protein
MESFKELSIGRRREDEGIQKLQQRETSQTLYLLKEDGVGGRDWGGGV